jgi:hypothetical protein
MIRNVVVPFIEAKDNRDVNINAFEIVNTEWVPEGTMLKRRINMMRSKCANQRFELGYKPKKDNNKWVARIKREARMTKIEGREPKEKLKIQITFPKPSQMIRSNDQMLKIVDLCINTLEYESKR